VAELRNRIRARRREREWTQQDLSERIGLTRQALSLIESGSTSPSTTIALKLAEAFECRVEDLFWTHTNPEFLEADLPQNTLASEGSQVVLGKVGTRWVAHPLSIEDRQFGLISPSGQVSTRSGEKAVVEPWLNPKDLQRQILIAGCAPPIAELERLTARYDRRARWLPRSSIAALSMLARGEVHIAGLHVADETGEYNKQLVAQTFAPSAVEMTTLFVWRMGLATAAQNPVGVRTLEDLLRPEVRFIGRAPDSGSYVTLQREMARQGLDVRNVSLVATAANHLESGLSVLWNRADVCLTVESVAHDLGLNFIPIAQERFDLVYPQALRASGDLDVILEAADSHGFHQYLESLAGYDATQTGARVALDDPES